MKQVEKINTIQLSENELYSIIKDSVMNILSESLNDYRIFNVKSKMDKPVSPNGEVTNHWGEREERLKRMTNSAGDPIYSFVVDTGHRNGDEIHTITEKGCILIINKHTGKLITVLLARPGQIVRYWKELGLELPKDANFSLALKFANNNISRGVNK